MRIYVASGGTPQTEPLAASSARIHAISVIDSAPGATIRLSRNGDFVPIYRGEVLESLEGWDWLEAGPGAVFTLRYFQAPLSVSRPVAASTAEAAAAGTASSPGEVLHAAVANPIAVAAGAVVQVLDANPQRSTLLLQNLGVNPLFWSTDAGLTNTGAKAEGVLAPGSVTNDGKGGFLALTGWLGPVYVAAAAGAASSLSAKAY